MTHQVAPAHASSLRPVIARTLSLVATWSVATYIFEGRIHTLLRPDAFIDRLIYAIVANLVIGTVGAMWISRVRLITGNLTATQLGFGKASHTLSSILGAVVIAVGMLALQRPPLVSLTGAGLRKSSSPPRTPGRQAAP